MSSTYEKALSLEWNGKVFILTMRNEITTNTTIAGNTYLYSYDGKKWLPSKISGLPNSLNTKWTGKKYLIESTQNMQQSIDGLNWSIINNNISTAIYDTEVNLEQTNTISFPQNTTLALGGVLADTTKIAYSTDSGLSWTPSQSSASVFSTACNNATWNGKIWVAVGSGGNTIATSPDGRTWTGRGSYIFTTQGNAVEWSKELCLWVAVGSGTNSIAYSTDGIYWFSALMSSSQGLTTGTDIKWNSRTWVATGTSSLIGIFTSTDGQNWAQVLLSNIALPTVMNYGGVWTQTTQITDSWIINAMNYTGQYQTAVDASGAVFISANFGANWSYSQFTLPSFTPTMSAFLAISSSGSQQYLLIGGGGLWISSTFGAAWSYNNNFPTNSYWTSVATDSIGLYVLASSASSVGASAGLWLSVNSGGTWSQIGSYSTIPFNGCTVSATGQYMSAIDIYGGIYISSNYGASWSISVVGSSFVVPTKIAASSSGQYLTASDYGTNTYTVDAYYTMLSSATNGIMDNAGNIYMGGSQSVPSQVIYKISSSGVITPVGNVGVYVNQNFAIAADNTNGLLYFIGVSGPTVYKTVISTGTTTAITALNTSLNGVSTATPSGIVCDSLGNLYILTSSTPGTTAYVCAYTTGSVFSTIITKTVTTGGLGLGIDKSNNIYLSYPTQVDQYSSGGILLGAGFYNSGRLVKYMTFDTTGNGYFYDVSGVYKVTLGQSSTYPSTQTFISGTTTNAYQIVQDSIGNFYISNGVNNTGNTVLQYSPTGSLLNASFISGSRVVGITFDKFNNLYVVNAGTNNVSQYKITNGAITSTNTTFITTGLLSPWACTFDNNGNFYVTNYGSSGSTGYICKYTMSNTSTNTITGTNTSLITGIGNPWTIACDSANNIYYSQVNTGTNNIIKYATGGGLTTVMSGFLVGIDSNDILYVQGSTSLSKYTSSGNLITSNYVTNLSSPQTLWFDALQNLYIQNNGNNTITRTSIVSNSTLITGLSSPQYTAVDSTGNVYTTNSTSGTVTKYSPIASALTTSGMNGAEQVGFDNNGNIYVSNYGGTVSQYNSSGTLLNANFITGGSSSIGMVLDNQNNIYLVNRPTGTTGYIAKYAITNGSLSSSNTSFITSLSGPQTLIIDSNNYLYISQTNNYGTTTGFISKYTTSGTLVTASFISSLNNPNQMAFDSYNNIYIALTNGNYITKYSYNGTLISSTFIAFTSPIGLAIDSYNNIYVSQSLSTGFVSKYNSTGILVSANYANIGGIQLNYLSLDSSNNLYAISGTNIVYKITNTNQTIISGLSSPTGCTIDSANNLYISNSGVGNIALYGQSLAASTTPQSTSTFANTGLASPWIIQTDSNGYLYVLNQAATTTNSINTIIQYNQNGTVKNSNFITAYASSVSNTCSMAIDSYNNMYILNGSLSIIYQYKINSSGTITSSNMSFINSGLSTPQYCGFDNAGNFYISCYNSGNGYINKYGMANGIITTTTANYITGVGNTWQMAFDSLNNIYVCNLGGNIYKYGPSGTLISNTFITIVTPMGITIDSFGYIYVSVYSSSGYIAKYNSTGTLVNSSYVTSLNQPSQLSYYQGNLYIPVSTGTGQTTGSILKISTAINPTYITGMTTPQGCCFDNSNNFYVSNSNSITKTVPNITPNNLTGYGTGLGAFCLTVDPANNIYVSFSSSPWLAMFTSTGTFVKTLISSPTSIYGVTYYNGYIYAFNYGTGNNVYRYNLSTNTSSVLISISNYPVYGSFDKSGNLYISIYYSPGSYGYIGMYTSEGVVLNANLITGTAAAGAPYSSCFDSLGYFYVNWTSGTSPKITKYLLNGSSAPTVIFNITIPGGTRSLTIDAYNNLFYGTSTIYVYSSIYNNNLFYTYNVASVGSDTITFDINGNILYWKYSASAGNLVRLNITNAPSVIISSITSPTAISIDSTNNLYIINSGNTVSKYTSTGTLTNASYITGLTTPKGLTIDTSKNFYVTSGSTVQKYNSSGTLLTSTYLQNLSSPIGLTIDSIQNLYVVQNGSNSITQYNTNTLLSQTLINASSNTLTTYLPSSYGFSTNPTNLFTIDSANNLYLSAPYPSNSFVIYKYSVSTLSTYYANAATPYLANDASYNLYWTTTANTVVKFNPYTKSQSIFIDISGSQQGVSVLQAPQGLTFDISQNLYLCCSGNIIKVAPITKAVSTFSTIQATYAIIADSSSNIYAMAATTPSHTVYKITQAGVQTTFFDSTKGLYNGYGLAIDPLGNIYIGSVNQAKTQTVIYKISPQGTQTTVYTTSTVNSVLGYAPLSVDKYGNLYLYDNNQIIVINPNGNTSSISEVSTLPTSIAFDNNNTIYMTDTSYNTSLNTILMGNTTLNTSSNYGATWTVGSLQNITAISNAGLYQSVIANGQVYISSNYGSSFGLATGLGFSNMKSVALSQNSYGGYFQTGVQSTGNIYTSNQVSYNNITKVLWNGTYWTGVIAGNTNPVLTSVNGLSWTNISGNPFSGNVIQNGFYSSRTNNSLFLSNTGNIFSTTTNNLSSLTVSTTGLISSPNALTYNGTYYLLSGNAVASSPDARTWRYGSAISGMSQINNFAWNNPDQGSASIAPISVALGAGSNTIAYSIDGIYWQGTGASVFTVQGNKAVWNGQLWCAVGQGGYWVATSYDGIIWTGRDNYWMQQGYDIAWNGKIFIAVGYGLVTMAASSDGINWQGIVRTPLDIYASSINWTGKIWIAYGSGATTSTAYSPQILGGGWQSTPQASIAVQNGQTVFTPAYFTTASLSGYSATASSQQVGNESYRAFDNKFSVTTGQVTSWYSASGTYAAATGQYLGSQTTSYNGGSIVGEWLQIQLPQPTIAIYYYIVFAIDSSNTAIPKGWTLLGSQTGTSWTLIENFSFGSQTTPPNNTNGYPFLVIPRNVINIGATYQYYRIIVPSVFGGGSTNYAEIAEFDIYTATSATNQLNYLTRPIVTNTYVLHPTNLINVQGVGYPTFYIATDLCGNQINNYYLNQAGYSNSLVYGLGAAYPVAQTFDGQNYLVLANSGTATYLSNQAANTTLNFSPIYNGATIQTNLTKAYTAAYNKRSILLGGANGQIGSITYATFGTGSSPIFKPTNASALFTAVYGLASNSGYGPVYVPNAIYMKPQDKISIIGPKAYPSAISNTAITMNLTNAQILTNITNSLNSIAIYGDTGPQGLQGVIGVQGPVGIGPIGPTGDNGFIGQTAITGAQGQIGDFGLTGPAGPLPPYWQVLGTSISYSTNIGINNREPIYTVDISGTANTNTLIVSGDTLQVLQNIQVGGASVVQTQVDISGSVIISNSMILGTMNTPPEGGLFIAGSQNISNISYMNQIVENLGQAAPDSIGNLILDLQQTASWVLDMSNCPNNITCQINNIPSTIINGFIYLTFYLDYSQAATPSGYYISSIVVGSQTYSILFNGGSPQNTTGATYFKQAIEIWISNSQIVRILSTI